MALGWLWWRAWAPLVAGDAAAGVAWHLGSCGALGRGWSPVALRQAWHFQTSTLCLRGMALMALGWLLWRTWAPLVAGDAAALCMAGVALSDIHALVAWQAWHLVTSMLYLHCGPGTFRHPHSLCVAGVGRGDVHLRLAWQAWRLVTSTFVWRGRSGTYGTGLGVVARLVAVSRP